MPRINLFLFLAAVCVLLPLIGLIFIAINPGDYLFLLDGRDHTLAPLLLYTAFTAVFFATWIFCSALIAAFPRTSRIAPPEPHGIESPQLVVVILATLALGLLALQVNPATVLAGEVDKSDVRALGRTIAFVAKNFMPPLFAYACLVYRFEPGRMSLTTVAYVGSVTALCGLTLGSKASIILVLLPGLLVLFWNGVKIRWLFGLAIAGFLALLVNAIVFDQFLQGNPILAVWYIFHRALDLTAETPYRITTRFLNGELDISYVTTLYSVVSNQVLTMLMEPDKIYLTSFSQVVSAELYPHVLGEIIAGRWNHTPPLYVEGIVALGWAFVIYAFFGAALGWGLIRWIARSIRRGRFVFASLLLSYFVFVYVAWLNSAGISFLVHPFIIGSMVLTWVILHVAAGIVRVLRGGNPLTAPLVRGPRPAYSPGAAGGATIKEV